MSNARLQETDELLEQIYGIVASREMYLLAVLCHGHGFHAIFFNKPYIRNSHPFTSLKDTVADKFIHISLVCSDAHDAINNEPVQVNYPTR